MHFDPLVVALSTAPAERESGNCSAAHTKRHRGGGKRSVLAEFRFQRAVTCCEDRPRLANGDPTTEVIGARSLLTKHATQEGSLSLVGSRYALRGQVERLDRTCPATSDLLEHGPMVGFESPVGPDCGNHAGPPALRTRAPGRIRGCRRPVSQGERPWQPQPLKARALRELRSTTR